MPPASFVRPGISSGDVWTLSMATEKLISTPLLQLSLIADAWPAPFVCFLLTYEHLFTPFFFRTALLLTRTKCDGSSISRPAVTLQATSLLDSSLPVAPHTQWASCHRQ